MQYQSTSITSSDLEGYFSIYPNPAFDQIVLEPVGEFPDILSVAIISENGKILEKWDDLSNSIGRIALPQVNGKLYLYLKTSKGILTQEIIRIND